MHQVYYLSIEGIPVIIRFKTEYVPADTKSLDRGIEGIPVIIRFKTPGKLDSGNGRTCIEGIPVIIRFKTSS